MLGGDVELVEEILAAVEGDQVGYFCSSWFRGR